MEGCSRSTPGSTRQEKVGAGPRAHSNLGIQSAHCIVQPVTCSNVTSVVYGLTTSILILNMNTLGYFRTSQVQKID